MLKPFKQQAPHAVDMVSEYKMKKAAAVGSADPWPFKIETFWV